MKTQNVYKKYIKIDLICCFLFLALVICFCIDYTFSYYQFKQSILATIDINQAIYDTYTSFLTYLPSDHPLHSQIKNSISICNKNLSLLYKIVKVHNLHTNVLHLDHTYLCFIPFIGFMYSRYDLHKLFFQLHFCRDKIKEEIYSYMKSKKISMTSKDKQFIALKYFYVLHESILSYLEKTYNISINDYTYDPNLTKNIEFLDFNYRPEQVHWMVFEYVPNNIIWFLLGITLCYFIWINFQNLYYKK